MSTTTTFKNDSLLHLFNNAPLAGIGDIDGLLGSAVPGFFHLSLHTSSPGLDGLQTANEAAYTSYLRIAVVRNSGGWTVVGPQVSNTVQALWALATGGDELITHWGVGTDLAGAGYLLASGTFPGAPLRVIAGIRPQADAGALKWTAA